MARKRRQHSGDSVQREMAEKNCVVKRCKQAIYDMGCTKESMPTPLTVAVVDLLDLPVQAF